MPTIVTEPRPFYDDRQAAGKCLAELLFGLVDKSAIVLAIPRGGVPVAVEIATELKLALDVLVTRKITIPSEPEAGYGAVAEDGSIFLNEPLVRRLHLSLEQIHHQAAEVKAEIDRRLEAFRGKSAPAPLKGKTVILVDDGLASGFTMTAAIQSARSRGAGRVAVAVPVASQSAKEKVEPLVDDLVCPVVSIGGWFAVASFYLKWYDLSDEEVVTLLQNWRERPARAASGPLKPPQRTL